MGVPITAFIPPSGIPDPKPYINRQVSQALQLPPTDKVRNLSYPHGVISGDSERALF